MSEPLLAACLRAAGVERVYGQPVGGMAGMPVTDPALACLLADADGRLGPAPGAALTPDGVLRLSSAPGVPAEPVAVDSPADLPDAIAWAVAQVPGAAALRLGFDPATPGVPPSSPLRSGGGNFPFSGGFPPPERRGGGVVVVVAGPGVVRAGPEAVAGLRALAAAGGLGVANTWGAKGLFAWDSPHHMGTAGLQERDFELLGLADAGLVLTTGLDPDESPPDDLPAGAVDVPPLALAALAREWPYAPQAAVPPNELYTRLAAVAQPLYASTASPLSPGRVVADLAATRLALVAADPGLAGFWVARTFPTTELGSVVVPATVAPGIGAALALVSGRTAVAVTTAPLDDATAAVLDLVRAHRAPVTVEVWGDDGAATPEEHAAALAADQSVIPVAVDWSDTDRLVEVAGQIRAWTGSGRAPTPSSSSRAAEGPGRAK